MQGIKVYTIGHGSRSIDEFLSLLKRYKVRLIADVRRWPTSKTEHFKREAMEKWLSDADISYVWLGEKLGGYRKGGYERYTMTSGFRQGISELSQICERNTTCIMCLEISPAGCHRRFISNALNDMGFDVVHIISKTKSRRSILPV